MSNSLMLELDEVLKQEIAQRHSYFQLKYFLVGKEPTNQSKMWQCLREMKTRRDSLEALNLEIEETKDRIELLDIAKQKALLEKNLGSSSFEQEINEKERSIKVRQIDRQEKSAVKSMGQLNEKKKWLEEECQFFLSTFKNLLQIEPLKHFDDLESQKEYWGEKLSQKLNLKMLTHNQLDTELIETIVALPDDIPVKQSALNTLKLRHEHMLSQLKSTMKLMGENNQGE